MTQVSAVFYISWRFSTQNICHEQLKEMCSQTFKEWIFQRELTGETNYHYQGYGHLSAKRRPKAIAIPLNEDFPGINMQACSSNGIEQLKKYCMKQDTRVQGPWGSENVYLGSDIFPESTFWPWQHTCKQLCLSSGNIQNRSINWVYNPSGGIRKSSFCKFMAWHYGISTFNFANVSDILNLVCKNQNKPCYLFDLTRTKPKLLSTDDLYSCMESISNGHFNNTKYQTEPILMDKPNIWVFANVMPKKSALTNDRWVVWYIHPETKILMPLEKYFAEGGLLPTIPDLIE